MTTEVETKETEQAESKPTISPEDFEALRESVAKLEAKNRELIEEKQRKAKEAKDAAEAAELAKREAAKKVGDTDSLIRSYEEKLTKTQEELRKEIEQRDSWLKDVTAGQAATALAAEIAVQGSARVLERHLRDRLTTDIREGKPTTVVLDADGRPSAMTLEDLKKEFVNDPAFAPLIVGSRATGPGGYNGKGSASALKRSQMTAAQKADYIKQHGQSEYLKLSK